MENKATPSPDSENYKVEQTEKLNMPKFNSATDKRSGGELPAIENMNDQHEKVNPEDADRTNMPAVNLGNDRSDDEKDDERIIRR
ncbi:MAG: hypothetical protein V4687_01570 [Bacteroidota bacterium]